MTKISKLSEGLAKTVPSAGSQHFFERLIDTIRSLGDVVEATIIVYRNERRPRIEFAIPDIREHETIDVFLRGAFLLDPYYLAAIENGQSGFFQLQELAPAGFRRSEYYKTYYRNSGLQDECGYLVPLEHGGFINITLGLTRRKAFARAQLKTLADIAPLVVALCHSHYAAVGESSDAGTESRASLQAALTGFGAAELTNREQQVIGLVLLGHATRSVAEQLEISYETVKLHRKHAYRKLGIRSQSELFHSFIKSMMSHDD